MTTNKSKRPAKKKQAAQPAQMLLASEDADFGLVPAAEAADRAQALANAERVTIYVRDPVTDEVIQTVEPEPKARKPRERRAAPEPGSMFEKIVALCARPDGATP